MYVCGITPYDATHMGHAATYVAFDLLNRAWRSAGHDVRYVQNVTDVDDPLLERADATGAGLDRARRARDRAVPHRHGGAARARARGLRRRRRGDPAGRRHGRATCSRPGACTTCRRPDLYFSVTRDPAFGEVSGWTREQMLEVFADRGGDPDRPGKKDPLDCLLWQAERPGEPAWDTVARPRPPRLARRVLGDRPPPPRRRDRRAGRRQRPRLPAPRDERLRGPGRRPGAPGSRRPTCTPGWSASTARRCRSPRATWCWSPSCARTASTRW